MDNIKPGYTPTIEDDFKLASFKVEIDSIPTLEKAKAAMLELSKQYIHSCGMYRKMLERYSIGDLPPTERDQLISTLAALGERSLEMQKMLSYFMRHLRSTLGFECQKELTDSHFSLRWDEERSQSLLLIEYLCDAKIAEARCWGLLDELVGQVYKMLGVEIVRVEGCDVAIELTRCHGDWVRVSIDLEGEGDR